mmetsp:Transcript_4188/g.6553  ORF Transcript_4188/g.6553 Transcript_4188/m.6553 type:complete len:107 (-) Transcript_4188:33-353(-)
MPLYGQSSPVSTRRNAVRTREMQETKDSPSDSPSDPFISSSLVPGFPKGALFYKRGPSSPSTFDQDLYTIDTNYMEIDSRINTLLISDYSKGKLLSYSLSNYFGYH